MQNKHENGQEYKHHKCTAVKKDDWLIFTCTQCDFVRRYNYKTGKMKTTGGDMQTLHNGMFIPVGLQPESISLN